MLGSSQAQSMDSESKKSTSSIQRGIDALIGWAGLFGRSLTDNG